jgi:hypothetical protein
MTIKVLIDSFSFEELKQIIDYYNNHKQPVEEQLEELNRAEGGFKIQITELKSIDCNENKKIKQLRWDKKSLVSKGNIGFTENEEKLLYTPLNILNGTKFYLINLLKSLVYKSIYR